MKIIYKINEGVSLELDAPKLQDAIKIMTEIREAIGHERCGKCQNEETYPRHRTAENNDFFEIHCPKCFAVLPLGTSKENQMLYKKRMQTDSKGKSTKDANGKAQYLPNNGWLKYNKETKTME
jgi:hypothetical protein